MQQLDFSKRSKLSEIIDDPSALSLTDWKRTLGDLCWVNRWLGGTKAILREVTGLIGDFVRSKGSNCPIQVVDFGCGSADIAVAMVKWARKKGHPVHVLAIDFNHTVCRIAREKCQDFPEITVIQGDVLHPPLGEAGCDLIFCSAFLHHFSDGVVSSILKNLIRKARQGVIISDLHRHPLSYWGIFLVSRLFSCSEAVCNDGPLSVLKGFSKIELGRILRAAGIELFNRRWAWAFRWVIHIPISR